MMKKIGCLMLLISGLTLSAQSAKLEYNLKKGDKYALVLTLKQNMAPILSMDATVNMTMNTTGVQNGNINSEYRIQDMKVEMSAQGETVQYDSKKKDSELTEEERKMKNEIAPALKTIVYQTMSKQGEIISMKMVPELKQAQALMSQNQFTTMNYPKEPLKVGTTWKNKQSVNGINVESSYKVTKITSDKVYADISGTIEGVAEAKAGGKLVIDRATGMIDLMDLDISANTMGMSLGVNVSMSSKKI